MTQVLRVDGSMRSAGSTTRTLTDRVIDKLAPAHVVTRDLADGIPFVSEDWINANFTDPAERTDAQRATLALSDSLVAELRAADVLVIGMPIYNFGIPAALKAWIDMIARARETFKYTETGPVGLLDGKRAIIVAASGGTEVDSGIDFATPYLRHALGFVGIDDVTVVSADRQMVDADAALKNAEAGIDGLAA
ncbi:MAG: NAD(P)H-dependent oxidoreductase [Pseudomonadota bacterium]